MFEVDKAAFGPFVAGLRKEKGYTQKELAEKLYVSDKAVSKWETCVSLPDTALLLPLAQLLGVSVTELLLCRREETEGMDRAQVEQVVKTAIGYGTRPAVRVWRERGPWKGIWLLCVVLGLGMTAALLGVQPDCGEVVLMPMLLGLIFSGYFIFFAPAHLPGYYDENRICTFSDGPVRMNLPGIVFHNGNWPHILRVMRLWSCGTMVLYPPAAAAAWGWLPAALWDRGGGYLLLIPLLLGLFLPLYRVGRRYPRPFSP